MKIFSVLSKEKEEVCIPSKWKKFWCNLFKIEIEKKYQFKIVLKMAGEETTIICVNDVIGIEGTEAKFFVLDVASKVITIRNLRPMSDFCVGTELFILYNAHTE